MSVGDYKPALGDSWTEEECDDDDDGAQSGEEEIEAMGDSHVQVHSVAPSRPPAPLRTLHECPFVSRRRQA